MTKEEKIELAEMINGSRKTVFDGNITEWLFRALVGITIFFGYGVYNDQKELKTQVTRIEIDKGYYEKEMLKISSFLEKPRFTKEDDTAIMNPVILQVNKNTNNIDELVELNKKSDKRITRLEYEHENDK